MRGLVAENERKLVLVAGVGDEGDGEPDDRPTRPVHRLERVRRLVAAGVDRDLEVAVGARCPFAADLLGHRLDPLHHRHEVLNCRSAVEPADHLSRRCGG